MQTIATSLGADRALGWGNDSSPCTDGWTGVVCNERGRVTAIRARNELDLRDNAITGQLPSTVFLRLERLRLDNNNFTSVAVGDNLFQGPLPVFAGSVQTDVAEASLDGSFCRPQAQPGPCDSCILAMSWKGNHPCDGWLGVHCDKSGSITGVNLCRLWSLVALLLGGNNITGVVPRSIAGLPSLRVLDVSHNSLEGTMSRFRSTMTIWAEGNPNLTVSGTSQACISSFVVAAMTVIVVLSV
ncbi:hypothetical protein VPH35_067483 [Triticum aestivum]